MTKKQKNWLWIFIAMFAVPEILFLNIISFILLFFGSKIPTIFSLIFKDYYFNPMSFSIIIIVEFIGALGLFIFSIKFNKKLFAILFGIILLCLFFIFSFIQAFSQMNFIL